MSADLVVYNQSIEEKPTSSVMADKKWLSVIDQNNGSYSSGQSTLETTSLSTSDRMMNYREAYLSVPLVLTAGNESSNNTTGLANATDKSKLMGLKNSYTSLVHSMSVDLNGTNIIQTTPFSELYNAFCLMTSLSWDDVKTQGSTIGFYPDDALSASSYTADAPEGTAASTVNNQSCPRADEEVGGVLGHIGNRGFAERLRYINYDESGKVGGATTEVAQSVFLTKANATVLYKNQVFNLYAGTTTESPVVQVQVMAIIKLRHLHSFFSVVPLARGLQFRFIINFNQSTTKLTTTTTDVTDERIEKTQFGGVNPLMVSSAASNGGGSGILSANGVVRFDLSVGRTCLDSVLSSHAGSNSSGLPQSVSLHVPSYIMNPSLAGAYISANSSKRITYSDIYQFKINGVASSESVNQLITSGIRGVRSVVMMPMLPTASNGATTTEYQSVQSDAGGGPTALLAQVTDFQVQVGGVNQIQSGGRYEWEIFQNFVAGAHGVNAGMTDGLTSSLIGQSDWARKYLYYYIDCNRGTDLERDTPKSIQIQFRNLSTKTMDYFVFVEFENSFALDVGTGNIVA
tara:strand:- start:2109 stop:3827 length:1719 start_codon:yes stop_codon:yes gene_type:complete